MPPVSRWGKAAEEGAEGSKDPQPHGQRPGPQPHSTQCVPPPALGGSQHREPVNLVQQHHWDLLWLGQGKKVMTK